VSTFRKNKNEPLFWYTASATLAREPKKIALANNEKEKAERTKPKNGVTSGKSKNNKMQNIKLKTIVAKNQKENVSWQFFGA